MNINSNTQRDSLLHTLREMANEQLDPPHLQHFLGFIDNAVHLYPDEDYLSRSAEDVFWAFYGLFQFGEIKDAEKGQVRVFNPCLEEDSWCTQRTTIYINQRDMPFLVDSLLIALNRRGLDICAMHSNPVWVKRDAAGILTECFSSFTLGSHSEAFIMIEVDHHCESELADLTRELLTVLEDVEAVADDFDPMKEQVTALITELTENAPKVEGLDESLEFLRWIHSGFYTFTGCVAFDLVVENSEAYLREKTGSRLGLLRRYGGDPRNAPLKTLNPGIKAVYEGDDIITFTKSSRRSRVHRDVYSDYVIVKRFDNQQKPIGEVRFLGIYTSQVDSYSPSRIPMVRQKVSWVMAQSGLERKSHNGKALQAILEFHPRDELFHTSREILAETAIGIWKVYDRRAVRVFLYPDAFNKFVSCMVYLPQESYNTSTREKIQRAIGEKLGVTESEFSDQMLPESALTRIYLVYQIQDKQYLEVKNSELEDIVTRLTHDWCDQFGAEAVRHWGEDEGPSLARLYQRAFPAAYRELYSPSQAVKDIELINRLEDAGEIETDFQYLEGVRNNCIQLKLYHLDTPLELSDMIPMLENMGFRVLVERPYRIQPDGGKEVWMQDFHLSFSLDVDVDISAVGSSFEDTLKTVWKGEAENDIFNRLVIGARLDWHAVAMLRLYSRYLKQLGISYSQKFIADTLAGHLEVTRNLVALFKSYFDPRYAGEKQRASRPDGLRKKILEGLDQIENLSEDNVLRSYLEVIEATLRTNFFQTLEGGISKPYISVKLQTANISLAPKPRPAYEIFVYSPRVEGVHLRGGKVARGGLRWSDRLEDYRTEVLGLVKAQQVKNAVIVPAGAKGGFVAKQANPAAGRKAWLDEGVACYMLYIQALLDITDNLVKGEVVPPADVVRRDGDDPYLVVAADKGTATFSDIANEISEANDFWLGDAFASGGSNGYDHKAMGITARGAWVAVQRHFREMGLNVQKENFTVVGIGDMGGDVFGNGMLLSEHIHLVAAFNHLHIFIDPNPDAATGFVERKRLFETPRATWEDYDKSLISKGGGVFSRAAKSIRLTPEIKRKFDIEEDELTPNLLLVAILKSRVDMIWNGGIGTYVKAAAENNAEVGDRANDSLRVNGRDLRCKVFGEGGNLGMTQRGRIEFCLNGGVCNTDFIDNAAGVDCSDHEVNIKILLNELVTANKLSVPDRNTLLLQMTDSVSERVLHNNYRQTQTISMSLHRSAQQHAEYQRFMSWLEEDGRLDPELEFLPNDDQLAERSNRGQPVWTRPELAVLISYSKVMLKEALLEEDLLNDQWLAKSAFRAFPAELADQYTTEIEQHQLRQEIVSTQLANDLVNRMGFTFFFRQMESTGASVGDVIRAYTIVINVLGIDHLWQCIEARDYQLPATVQLDLLQMLKRLTRRATRWYLRNCRQHLQCEEVIKQMTQPVQEVLEHLAELHQADWFNLWRDEREKYCDKDIEEVSAGMLASSESMFLAIGIADTALQLGKPVRLVTELYFNLGESLSLDWFMSQIVGLQPKNRWQDLARESHVDDLENLHRRLTAMLLKSGDGGHPQQLIEQWQEQQSSLIARWKSMVAELRNASGGDFTMTSVALRELLDLVQSTIKFEKRYQESGEVI